LSELLLGTRALKALIAGDPILTDWLSERGNQPLHVSTPSVAWLLASAETTKKVAARRQWIEELTEVIPARYGPRLHGFDLSAAKHWSAVRANLDKDVQIEECDLFVIAVALAENLDYVAHREAWHGSVNGLRQHDPWTSKSYPN
jgi:predicted nucleic acid-binding protein